VDPVVSGAARGLAAAEHVVAEGQDHYAGWPWGKAVLRRRIGARTPP
jgi:hypothetical protein